MKGAFAGVLLVIIAVAIVIVIISIPGEASPRECRQTCREQVRWEREACRDIKITQQREQCIDAANARLDACLFSCEEVTCCLSDDNCYTTIIRSCREAGGAVMECLGGEKGGQEEAVGALVNFTPANLSGNGFLTNLSRDVASTGINNTPYTAGHDCDDFADELERNLTAMGYDATVTLYWCYGGAGNPAVAKHAVTDVHMPDGRMVFIEPQTGRFTNLDFDGDGNVEVNDGGYTPGKNKGQTDDNCKISVFDNMDAAKASGAPVD